MRIGRMSVFALAVAVFGALALVGIAIASGDSTATFEFTPDKVPKRTYSKGKLFVHTHTDYTGGTRTLRTQLYFDDDLKIRTTRIPRCNAANISGNTTMKQAMARCGDAKVGSGRAEANAAVPGDVKGCVLAFNGQQSGGRPTLVLFTRLNLVGPISCANPAQNTNGNTTVLLQGLLKGASGDYGTQLDVNNIPGPLPLSDFQVSVKRGRYVSARCHDGNKTWNMKAKFTYVTPSATQTVNSSETCRVKH